MRNKPSLIKHWRSKKR